MELNYLLEEKDYLCFQLYFASKNPQIKKQRSTARTLGAIVLLLIAILFFLTNERFEAYYFLASTVIILMIYPWCSAWALKYSFKRFVKNNYRKECPKSVTLRIENNAIESFEKKGHAKSNISEIEKITEIDNYFFMHVNDITAYIIPKAHLSNVDNIRKHLIEITENYDIPFNSELGWKFK